MRVGALIATLLVPVLVAGCFPMVNPGYISMPPRQGGKVDFQAHAGGGFPYLGWGSVHVEPYATSKLSIPIGATVSYPGAGAGRVGARYRATRILSVGGGAGVSVLGLSVNGNYGSAAYGLVDLELGLGNRWGIFGFSFAFRPTYLIPTSLVYLPVELGFAFYVSKNWALTLLVNGGLIVGSGLFGGGGGGALGVIGHL